MYNAILRFLKNDRKPAHIYPLVYSILPDKVKISPADREIKQSDTHVYNITVNHFWQRQRDNALI